jgi:hypothetical protein
MIRDSIEKVYQRETDHFIGFKESTLAVTFSFTPQN